MNKRLTIGIATLLLAGAIPLHAQHMEAKHAVIDCGQILFRQPVSIEFEIKNKGDKPLTVSKVRTSCGCTAVDYPQVAVSKGDTFKVTATYDARQMGHFEKQVGIYAENSSKPLMLTLRGVVVEKVVDFAGDYPCNLGGLRTDRDNLEFDDVNRGDRLSQKIHVFNATSQPVEPQVMHLPDYLQAQVSPSKIAVGRSGVITISLDSRKLRDFGLSQTSVYLGLYPGDKVSADKEIPVSAVLLPDFRNMTDEAKAAAPRMQLSATTLEMGSFDGKKKKKAEITITNTGRTTLEISSIQMFTEGLQLSLSSKTLAPGATSKLKVTAIASELKKVRTQPRILMITNDPQNAKVSIAVNIK